MASIQSLAGVRRFSLAPSCVFHFDSPLHLSNSSDGCNDLQLCFLLTDFALLQEAKKRPTFAEIIQVLRRLFGEEARRNPATGPGEMMPERVLQASTSSGSGELSQKAQVAICSTMLLEPCS